MTFGFQVMKVFGELRRVPSPEQGASRRILSNLKFDFERFEQSAIASFRVTIVFETPQRSRFETRIEILSMLRSFAINEPQFCIFAAI